MYHTAFLVRYIDDDTPWFPPHFSERAREYSDDYSLGEISDCSMTELQINDTTSIARDKTKTNG